MGSVSRQSAKAPNGRDSSALWRFGESSLFSLVLLPLLLAAAQSPPEPPKKPVAPLKVAPREYFTAHCQRCHGVDGINFIPGFADEPAEKLKADIAPLHNEYPVYKARLSGSPLAPLQK